MPNVTFFVFYSDLKKYCKTYDYFDLGNADDYYELAKSVGNFLTFDEFVSVAKNIVKHTSNVSSRNFEDVDE